MFDLRHLSPARTGFPMPLFFALFLPVALLIVGGAWFVGQERIDEEMSLARSSEIGNVVLGVRRLDDELQAPLMQLRALARDPALLRLGGAGAALETTAVAAAFSRLIAYNDRYDKLRWIDTLGRERVRVNNLNGEAATVGAAELQSLAGSYFVKEGLRLKPGEVYVSPLDLNMERGQVERPYKPVMRLVTPIHGEAGESLGILVVNVTARGLLEGFANSLMEARDHAMLLNAQGYWLKSPDASQEWGFMFKRNETLGARHPEAWRAISAIPSGQVELADGLWTWSTAYPLKVDASRDTSSMPVWLVVTHLSRGQLDLIGEGAWRTVGTYAAGLLLLYGLLAAWLSRAVVGRARAVAEAAKAHAEALAADRLRLAQERFRLVVEANTNGLLVVDKSGRLVLVNPALSRMFGYTSDELIGQPLEMLLPDRLRAQHGGFFAAYMRQPQARPMGQGRELVGRRKDGGEFPLEISLSPFTENGETFVDAFVADISARKESERLRQRSETRLRLMLHTNPSGVLVVDEQGAIEMANPALERMFGYGHGELVNQSVERLLPKALQPRHVQLRQAYLSHPTIRPMGAGLALEGMRKDGSSFPLRISLASFIEDGKTYVQAIVVDLSQTEAEPLAIQPQAA